MNPKKSKFTLILVDQSFPKPEKVRPPGYSRKELETMLSLLNEQLGKNGITGEICIVGGAAMILAFGSRESTRDIDALVMAPAGVRAAVAQVAESNGFSPTWLNDGVKGFASGQSTELREILKFGHLRVVTPPAEYILAMKCLAARVGLDEHDKEDAKFLIKHIGLRGADAVLGIVERYYPRERIPAKTQYFIQEVCDEIISKT
ncbi:MAG TPA: DUF6036 family nucleotidyltransferase [Verrucomicrobiae bacterium]